MCVCEAIVIGGRYFKKHKKSKSEQMKPKITETLKKTDVSEKVVVKRFPRTLQGRAWSILELKELMRTLVFSSFGEIRSN